MGGRFQRPVFMTLGDLAHLLPLACCLLSMFPLTGCGFITVAHITVNDPIDEEDVAFIIPGQTTFSEIIERLGAPDELAGVEDGKRAVIFYHFRDAKYSRVNFGWPLRFWTPVQPDFIFSGLGFGTDVFEVALNRDWVVQYHAFAKHVPPASRYNPWLF